MDKYHNVFHITEKETGLMYFKDLELHTIELKKFTKHSRENLKDLIAKVKNSLDIWLAFLTRHDLLNKDNLPSVLDNPALKKALNVLDIMNFKPDEREAYEEHLKWLRIEANTLKKYESKGFSEGKAQGIEEGKAQGIEEGKVLGVQERNAEIAANLLKRGIPLSTIAAVTGLSEELITGR